jgi:hypothetical protein
MRTITVTVGPNAAGGTSSSFIRLDEYAFPQIALQVVVSGSVNYTVQQTLDDPNSPTDPVASGSMTWFDHADSNLVATTTSAQGNYAYPPTFTRVVINSGTGSVTFKVTQAANVPA